MRNASSVRNSTATISAGLINGSVILKNRCSAVAPSTLAALYRSSGTSASAPSSSSAMNGVVFQTSAPMITKNDPARVVSGGVESPNSEGTKPVAGSKASFHANAETTVTAPYGTSTATLIHVRA